MRNFTTILVLAAALALAACGSTRSSESEDSSVWRSLDPDHPQGAGVNLTDLQLGSAESPSIGVNGYLWRATLDTLSFMPLASADPFGGVIITDWYAAPESPNERMKVTAYILDRNLRADGVKIAVFRQQFTSAGWTDAQVNPQTAVRIENAVLTRARELKLATLEE